MSSGHLNPPIAEPTDKPCVRRTTSAGDCLPDRHADGQYAQDEIADEAHPAAGVSLLDGTKSEIGASGKGPIISAPMTAAFHSSQSPPAPRSKTLPARAKPTTGATNTYTQRRKYKDTLDSHAPGTGSAA
jgi:hypothetical protein